MTTQAVRFPAVIRAIVLASDGLEIHAIAAQVGVSSKTISRDLAALCDLGFPLQEETGAHGRKTYRLPKDAIQRIGFRYDEALAIMLCQHATKVFAGTPLGEASDSAFEKVRLAFGPRETAYLDRLLPRIHRSHVGGDYSRHGEILDSMTLAIEESRATFITYRSRRSTDPVTYDIHPYGLAEHRGSLYVVGFSCEHGEIRTWKVDRMDDAEVTRIPFERPLDFRIEEYLKGALAIVAGTENHSIRVRIARSAARYVAEKKFHASQQIEPQADGSIIATFELSSLLEIKSWVLSFGAAAEVLAPTSLRKEVRDELGKAARQYQTQRSRE